MDLVQLTGKTESQSKAKHAGKQDFFFFFFFFLLIPCNISPPNPRHSVPLTGRQLISAEAKRETH